MKKVFALILCVSLLLCGCSAAPQSIKDDNPVVPETVKSVWMAYFELENTPLSVRIQTALKAKLNLRSKKLNRLG